MVEKTLPSDDFDIFESKLVPKHEILNEDEKRDLMAQYKVDAKQLPRIKANDPAAKRLGAKKGEVLRIIRKSPTAGDYKYFRIVV